MKSAIKQGTILFFILFQLSSGCIGTKEKIEKSKQQVHSSFKTKKGKTIYLEAYDVVLTSLWDTPYTEIDIPTLFGKAHVIISGPKSAPPLILLHGMNASSTMWYPNTKVFAEKYRVYCIDFILEPGKSASNGEIKRIDDLVTWYDEIFDYLQLDQFAIVGASRGGWLATELALHSKKKITKIALLSPAQTFTWIKPKKQVFKNIIFEIYPKRKRLKSVLQTLTANVDQLKQPYIDQYYLAVTKSVKSKSIFQVKPFTDEKLQSLTVPVLLLIGDQDIINDTTSLERAKKLIPNIETHIIKEAGHFVSFDQPEMINQKVLQFLESSK